jgi:hypothetical protein
MYHKYYYLCNIYFIKVVSREAKAIDILGRRVPIVLMPPRWSCPADIHSIFSLPRGSWSREQERALAQLWRTRDLVEWRRGD